MVGGTGRSVASGAEVPSGKGHATVAGGMEVDIKGTEVKEEGDGRMPRLEWCTLRPEKNSAESQTNVSRAYSGLYVVAYSCNIGNATQVTLPGTDMYSTNNCYVNICY